MSARDRFREAEKQSMKAYNRRQALTTPPTDIDRNVQLDRNSQPFNRSDRLIRGQDTNRGYDYSIDSGSRFQTSPDDDLYPSKGPVPNIRYTPRQYADMNSGSRSAFTVLENEADPLSTDVRTSGRFAGKEKGLYEPIFEGLKPRPFRDDDAERRTDEISRTADYAMIAAADEERRRRNLFNESRDRVASASRKLPTDLQGISELFGDTEMGFDFLRRSNFNEKMQAGLRDTRPMSEYVTYAKPGSDEMDALSSRNALGTYSNNDDFSSLNPSEALSMQTPTRFGTRGNIDIRGDIPMDQQTRTLFHEFMHKGDIPLEQRLAGTKGRVGDLLGPQNGYDLDHQALAAETNMAFAEDMGREGHLNEMQKNIHHYMTSGEKERLVGAITTAISNSRDVGRNPYNKEFESSYIDKEAMEKLKTDVEKQTMGISPYKVVTTPTGVNFGNEFSDAEVRIMFDTVNTFMLDSQSKRESKKQTNRDVLKAAENFSARFAKGGIISALMEGK
jgi:hypothetical protein